jgi:hypothetical protein
MGNSNKKLFFPFKIIRYEKSKNYFAFYKNLMVLSLILFTATVYEQVEINWWAKLF